MACSATPGPPRYSSSSNASTRRCPTLSWCSSSRSSGNRYILYRLVNASGRQRRIGSVDEHAAVLKQLETGNAAAAVRAIKNPIDHAAT